MAMKRNDDNTAQAQPRVRGRRPAFSSEDAKDYALTLADEGQILVGAPLDQTLLHVLRLAGFERIRLEQATPHRVWIGRMRIGSNRECGTPQRAVRCLRRLGRIAGELERDGVTASLAGDGIIAAFQFKGPSLIEEVLAELEAAERADP